MRDASPKLQFISSLTMRAAMVAGSVAQTRFCSVIVPNQLRERNEDLTEVAGDCGRVTSKLKRKTTIFFSEILALIG